MDIRNRMLLQQHQQLIVNDLDVRYILDELFSKQAISHKDFDHIYQLNDRADRVRFLIKSILQNGNNSAYDAFVDSLAKDYNWIWKKFALADSKAMIEDSFEDSISRGDVPRLPDHFVRRIAVEEDVANKLKTLTRHKILALHGMSGSGKTCVAISVLRNNPELVTDDFNGVVFWRNLGNCKTEDDIIAQQNKLYRKASILCNQSNNSFMNSSISMSSIGSNADSVSSSDWTCQELKDRLRAMFSDPALKKALLVLDEVNEKKCLEAFDIGCKILVTTRDTDVICTFHPQIVKIENHFTEEESLSLLSSCIDVPESKLPRQAKRLHEICKGSPFHIALIGAELAENKERLVHDTRHWNYYLNKLEKKEFFFLTKQNGNPMKPIEMCINSLKPDILPLFKMLSILPDNAKVSAKVLSKLWNRDISKVESIMKQLRSKSLIIEFYDQEQRNYIYEVHDLIMNYLKTTVTEDEVRKLHRDFLKSYKYDADNAPEEIEDDGYIAFYIGYHLFHTQNLNKLWSLFGKLFLDLKFLGNKVRLTGPADVILDLRKYEDYIVDGELDKELLYSIRLYLSTHGTDLYRSPSTDIVQSILQHESKGILYTKASSIAQQGCDKNEVYFEFLHEQNVEEIKHTTIDAKEIITTVCFLRNYVMAGTVTGAIKFFEISTNKLKKEVQCGAGALRWVGVCPASPARAAALAADGALALYYLDELDWDADADADVIEEENEEPLNNNDAINTVIQPKLGPFLSCRWANTDELIITHTAKEIIIYKTNGQVHYFIDNLYRNSDMLCCVLCNFDKHAIVASAGVSTYTLDVIDLKTKTRHSFAETGLVLDILVVSDNKIITLKEKEISEFDCKMSTYIKQTCTTCNGRVIITAQSIKPNMSFLSMAVNKSGTLMFVSTDDSRVLCIDLKTSTHIFDLENRRGNVVTMAMSEFLMDDFEPGSDVLLTGTGTIENSLKVWFLDPSFVSQNAHKNAKVRLTTKFDASFIATLSPHTPTQANSSPHSTHTTPQRHQSFASAKEVKKILKSTMSLDRHMLKPLNLKGICNGSESTALPLLAVVDDKNNIQVMRGRKILTEISTDTDEIITTLKISPCNQHVIYGLQSGIVRKFSLRTKENIDIMDVYSPVKYLNFVNADILIVAGKNRCIMAYRLMENGDWKPEMLQRGNCNLGSQELLNNWQGVKKKQGDQISNSSSEMSMTSRSIVDNKVFKPSNLVDCYWLKDIGLITIESNATIKLWDEELKLASVLNGKQADVCIRCSAFEKDVLVICDDRNLAFQTFELKKQDHVSLRVIQESQLNNRITCCALNEDGHMLALGLDSGDVAIWNVLLKRQVRLLKQHKSKVQWCGFAGAPPLVLLTLAADLVWWDVTYLIRNKPSRGWKGNWNVVTPIASPLEPKTGLTPNDSNSNTRFFFGDNPLDPHYHWKLHWKGKTCKEGSKRKEILACIKLYGMYAKSLRHDEKFCCFVTVDNTGHIHIMTLMDSQSS